MADNQGTGQIDVDPQPQAWSDPIDDAGQPVAQINYTTATDEERTSRSLKGSPPKIFDGERENSENFMDEFDIYTKINRKNDSMKEAYSRVLMCLSFIKGKKVRDWAKGRVVVLDKEVKDGTRYDDERLWTDFGNAFVEAFTDTTRAQDAYNKLKELKMEGDDLDSYVSAHTTLVRLSEWAPEGEAAIETFKEGLKRQLRLAVMRRDYQPKTLKEWKDSARIEQNKWKAIKSSGVLDKKERRGQWKAALGKTQSASGRTQPKAKDPDAMEIDNTRLNPLTDEERKQLMKEGKCFRCRRQGHMSNACPNKQNNYPPKTRVNEIVDDRDDKSEIGSERSSTRSTTSTRSISSGRSTRVNNVKMGSDEVIRALEGLTKEERGDVLDQILLKGEDF